MYRTLSAPIFVHLETTRICNYRCRHCYNGERTGVCSIGPAAAPEPMDIAREMIDAGIFSAVITGGEPLLVLDQWYEALLALRDAGIRLSMNSNLSVFSDRHAAILHEIGVKGILTSLMSHDPDRNDYLAGHHGAQEKTMRGIKAAQEAGFHISVNMVCTKTNLADIRETAALVQSLGVRSFCVTKATRSGDRTFADQQLDMSDLRQMLRDMLWVRDNLGLKVDTLEPLPACCFEDSETRSAFGRRQCNAGISSAAISEGRLVPCPHFSDYVSSDTVDDGIKSAWSGMSEWRGRDSRPTECQGCPEFPFRCACGCRASAQGSTGSMCGLDPHSETDGKIVDLIHEPEPTTTFSDDTVFMPARLRFRTEDGFYVAFLNGRSWLLVDQAMRDLLTRDSFTLDDLAQAYDRSPDQVQKTAHVLLKKGMVSING